MRTGLETVMRTPLPRPVSAPCGPPGRPPASSAAPRRSSAAARRRCRAARRGGAAAPRRTCWCRESASPRPSRSCPRWWAMCAWTRGPGAASRWNYFLAECDKAFGLFLLCMSSNDAHNLEMCRNSSHNFLWCIENIFSFRGLSLDASGDHFSI